MLSDQFMESLRVMILRQALEQGGQKLFRVNVSIEAIYKGGDKDTKKRSYEEYDWNSQ